MRIANLAGRLVLVTDDGSIDVEGASGGAFGAAPNEVYERWDEFVDWATATPSGPTTAIDETQLGPPSPFPRQVFGVGANYRAHVAEAGAELPKSITVFTKWPSCITGPQSDVPLPKGSVDWEAELVLVVGRRAFHVPRSEGWDYLAGVTVGQDISERDIQRASSHFCLAKSFPGFGPTGPYLVSPDEFPNRDELTITCSINGEQMQNGNTNDMVYPVAEIVAQLSAVCPLLPGDVIFTGTPPGVGLGKKPPMYLSEGDEIVTGIEGIGTMRNRCVAEAKA
jgi:2,4-didehydro-3-deoxy-L-rhamnonate hydrolase